MTPATAIVLVYKARKARVLHPAGDFGSASRWTPSSDENADCYTANVRTPSRRWPYSYMKAARTKKHLIALAVDNVDFLLAEAERVEARYECSPTEEKSAAKAMAKLVKTRAKVAAEVQAYDDARAKRIADAEAKAEAALAEEHGYLVAAFA